MEAPPPPYAPAAATHFARRGPAAISDLPLHLLHRILSLTLDPKATPSRWSGDAAEEKVRRLWALFRSFRGVDRRFYLVSMSILRTTFLSIYTSLLLPGSSSDAYPSSSSIAHNQTQTQTTQISQSVFSSRHRETAIFDRFIAVRVGEDLRKIETELYEESEAEQDIFKRLQPSSRIEDLLLGLLPPHLVVESGEPRRQLPLPHSHLSVILTPTWAQLFLHSHRIGSFPKERVGRDLVVEVKRQKDAEGTAKRLRDGLEDMNRGLVPWSGRVL